MFFSPIKSDVIVSILPFSLLPALLKPRLLFPVGCGGREIFLLSYDENCHHGVFAQRPVEDSLRRIHRDDKIKVVFEQPAKQRLLNCCYMRVRFK